MLNVHRYNDAPSLITGMVLLIKNKKEFRIRALKILKGPDLFMVNSFGRKYSTFTEQKR